MRNRPQRALKIRVQILDFLDPNRHSDQPVRDSEGGPDLGGNTGVGGEHRTTDEGLHPPETGSDNGKLQTPKKLLRRRSPSLQLETEDAAAPLEQPPGALVLRVVGQSGVIHPLYRRLALEEFGQGQAVAAAMESIGRNPNSADRIQTPMIIGIAFMEALGIYALVVAFLLVGKI